MKRAAFVTGVAVLASLLLTAAVHAITFGEADDGRHPFVGALVAEEADGDKFQICSGTLVSPTVFVTASHCLVGLAEFGIIGLQVTFDETIDADQDGLVDEGVTLHDGTAHPNPQFGATGGGSDPHDVGVFVLDAGVEMDDYGLLPEVNQLNTVNKGSARFTTVGYGIVRDDKRGGNKSFELSSGRKMATQELLSLQKFWATFSMNPSTGSGGTCLGDSGGPHFLGADGSETRIVVALTVTGDRWCRALDRTYRLDTASARAFLDDYVTLP